RRSCNSIGRLASHVSRPVAARHGKRWSTGECFVDFIVHSKQFSVKIIVVCTLSLAGLSPAVKAQVDSASRPARSGFSIGDTLLADAKASFLDGVLVFTAPARFGARGWLTAGAAIA